MCQQPDSLVDDFCTRRGQKRGFPEFHVSRICRDFQSAGVTRQVENPRELSSSLCQLTSAQGFHTERSSEAYPGGPRHRHMAGEKSIDNMTQGLMGTKMQSVKGSHSRITCTWRDCADLQPVRSSLSLLVHIQIVQLTFERKCQVYLNSVVHYGGFHRGPVSDLNGRVFWRSCGW